MATDGEAGHRQMSKSNDPVLEFLTRWLLEFGGEATGGQVAERGWYRESPVNLSHLINRHPPLLERSIMSLRAESRTYCITQAGLDYIKHGRREG